MKVVKNELSDTLFDLTFADLYLYTKELVNNKPGEQIKLFDDSDEYAASAISAYYDAAKKPCYILHLYMKNIIDEYQEITKFVFVPSDGTLDIHFMNDIGANDYGVMVIENFSIDYLFTNSQEEWDADDVASGFMTRKAIAAVLCKWKMNKIAAKKSRKLPQAITEISPYYDERSQEG
jgi:hypothetical protein